MALKTVLLNSSGKSTAGASPTAPPAEEDTVLLELAMYTNYTWKGEAFQKGKAYKFTKDNAMQLLQELDHGRQVWRIFRPTRPKVAPKDVAFDATAIKADAPVEFINGIPDQPDPTKRIDIGTDEEIADILGRPDTGNVTV